MKVHHVLTRILIAPVAVLLLSYGMARSGEHLHSVRYSGTGYIKLVNATKNYVTIKLYVDGDACGAAPQGDSCICPVNPGTHNLRGVGVDSRGSTDSASRTATVDDGATFTWTISEKDDEGH